MFKNRNKLNKCKANVSFIATKQECLKESVCKPIFVKFVDKKNL